MHMLRLGRARRPAGALRQEAVLRRRGHFIRCSRTLPHRLGPNPQHAGLRAARLGAAPAHRDRPLPTRGGPPGTPVRAGTSGRAPGEDPRRVVRQPGRRRFGVCGPPAAREPRRRRARRYWLLSIDRSLPPLIGEEGGLPAELARRRLRGRGRGARGGRARGLSRAHRKW